VDVMLIDKKEGCPRDATFKITDYNWEDVVGGKYPITKVLHPTLAMFVLFTYIQYRT
jgi:hypothetical protein